MHSLRIQFFNLKDSVMSDLMISTIIPLSSLQILDLPTMQIELRMHISQTQLAIAIPHDANKDFIVQ